MRLLDALNTMLERRFESYDADPGLLREHYNTEQIVLAGGYGYRQILELVQNGADAILEADESNGPTPTPHRIDVLLTETHLYVANTGAPLSEEGLDALLRAHSSPKRGRHIGRFGLGFKSLLKLGGCIDIFTRCAGQFRFDPERCRHELQQRYGHSDVPRLRLAWPLDDAERQHDPHISELDWAETIVRAEVCTREGHERLRDELRGFPAQFLLFFPVSVELLLMSPENAVRRLRVECAGDEVVLHEDHDTVRYLVVKRDVCITDSAALEDATDIHGRKQVPLSWAVPLDAIREEAGRFWAFFPTQTPTFLPGILNAPWKLNSDRNGLIPGPWNKVLMKEAAQLIAHTLPRLATPEDPGRPLDFFPREIGRKDDIATDLVEQVWQDLSEANVLADQRACLRRPKELWRHPRDAAEVCHEWCRLATSLTWQIVHPSCMQRARASRLERLAQYVASRSQEPKAPNLRRVVPESWFSAVAATDMARAKAVLRLAELFQKDCKPDEWSGARPRLKIVVTTDEQLVTPAEAMLALEGCALDGRRGVAHELAEDAEARRILREVLGVEEVNLHMVQQEALRLLKQWIDDDSWDRFWPTLRSLPRDWQVQVAKQHRDDIHVQRRDGTWHLAEEVLFPGSLVPAECAHNGGLLLHDNHLQDKDVLEVLNVAEWPNGNRQVWNPEEDPCLWEWMEEARGYYRTQYTRKLHPRCLGPRCLTMPRGFALLRDLRGHPKARLTERWLKLILDREWDDIRFGHTTVRSHPEITISHALRWWVLRYGALQVGSKTVPLCAVAARLEQGDLMSVLSVPDLEAALKKLERVLPPVEPSADDLKTLWATLLQEGVSALATGEQRRRLYAAATKDRYVPERLRIGKEILPIAQVYVTTSRELAEELGGSGVPIAWVTEATSTEWVRWGARDADGDLVIEWDIARATCRLCEVEPALEDVLTAEAREKECRCVRGLRARVGGTAVEISCLVRRDVLTVDEGKLAELSPEARLASILRHIDAAGWLNCTLEDALQQVADAEVVRRRREVRQADSLPQRLLRAVGGAREPLLAALGNTAGIRAIAECTDEQLAQLVLCQLGPSTLSRLSDTLEALGLKPPATWNSAQARDFVTSLGFPAEFADSSSVRREPEEYVTGPIELPELHDYQQEVFAGLKSLMDRTDGSRRAVVALPTGSGKTRVTVEAAVRLVLRPLGERRYVLWIAQTDELCEQAVQAFRQVWVNCGARGTNLRIIRLWGGHRSPVERALIQPTVVVASVQTLSRRVGSAELSWLASPRLVVFDECHHAITRSYSDILRWMGMLAPSRGPAQQSAEGNEPVLIGLSATPFRMDDEESKRLAARFGNTWLPLRQADLYRRLQAQGVLATVTYEELDSPAGLTYDEEQELTRLWDGSADAHGLELERLLERINQRLAQVEARNRRILQCLGHAKEQSILLFANSVEHAEQLSAQLNLAGIPSAPVSGDTPLVARRYFIDRFQKGELRVLCNHTVLATGFDAPKTDLIVIARQVFSPVRFMQMVGRGLRGPRNGGTERCRIVTVMDNLGRFKDRHPYHYCRRYFEPSAGETS